MENYLPLIILLLPFLGAALSILISPHYSNCSGIVATSAIFLSFIFSLFAFFALSTVQDHQIQTDTYIWLSINNFQIPFSLLIDKLSSVIILIVTGIGSLIHLYSIGYMKGDAGISRYFSYLNLFCFAMLLLVMSTSFPLLFLGWEGVGLCSYLLIGFWFTDLKKTQDGMKAFILNRVGDLGFLLGMFLIYTQFGSFEFSVLKNIITVPSAIVTTICLLLFVGATGKSAQIPLYTWFPDAMSGPTPVSALIHAATMVTAGVYMIIRLSFLYELSPFASHLIACVGGATALFAATIAIAQNDIKKVWAYSTVSQLGLMFMAVGLFAYEAALFHLITHAFFKALLFLSAGSVIHACSGEQDMRKMGGLKKYLPHTYITMVIGVCALSGIPFFCGFFSKDEILTVALNFNHGENSSLFIVGILTSLLTAIYSGRVLAMTFLGKENFTSHIKSHLHESPWVMTLPLYVLAFFSVIGGVFAKEIPHAYFVMILSSLVAITGLVLGLKQLQKNLIRGSLLKLLENKYYIDEIYDAIFVRPVKWIGKFITTIFDPKIIDSFLSLITKSLRSLGEGANFLQNGKLDQYLLTMAVSLAIMIILVVIKG